MWLVIAALIRYLVLAAAQTCHLDIWIIGKEMLAMVKMESLTLVASRQPLVPSMIVSHFPPSVLLWSPSWVETAESNRNFGCIVVERSNLQCNAVGRPELEHLSVSEAAVLESVAAVALILLVDGESLSY